MARMHNDDFDIRRRLSSTTAKVIMSQAVSCLKHCIHTLASRYYHVVLRRDVVSYELLGETDKYNG